MKLKVLGIFITIIMALIFMGEAVWGWTLQPSPPGSSTDSNVAFCYSISTFEILPCTFTFALSEGPDNGGHFHSGRPIGGLRFAGESGAGSTSLSFGTGGEIIEFEYVIPPVSGDVRFMKNVIPPPMYICVPSCYAEWVVEVTIKFLERLPDSSPFHVVVRGGTDTHPEGTRGKPDTIERLQKIAQEYFKFAGRKLSINDLSLPKGGLFDLNMQIADTDHIALALMPILTAPMEEGY